MRSYRDIPSDQNPRQAAMEQRKKQSIIERARRDSEILRRIEHQRCEERARTKVLFLLWMILDRNLHQMEQQRDMHTPITPDDPWDDQFCEAIRIIPSLKSVCRDAWHAYANNELTREEVIR